MRRAFLVRVAATGMDAAHSGVAIRLGTHMPQTCSLSAFHAYRLVPRARSVLRERIGTVFSAAFRF